MIFLLFTIQKKKKKKIYNFKIKLKDIVFQNVFLNKYTVLLIKYINSLFLVHQLLFMFPSLKNEIPEHNILPEITSNFIVMNIMIFN